MVKYKLLHAHGQAGPRGTRSYISFGTYSTRLAALKSAKAHRLDSKRIALASRVFKSKLKGAKGLYYVK